MKRALYSYLFLIFSICSCYHLSAQANIDSLKYEVHQKEGLSKAKVLSKLIDLLKTNQPQEALSYARQLKPLLVYGNENDRYNLTQQFGRIFHNIGMYDSALVYHKKCLALAREMEEPRLVTASFLNISEDYRVIGLKDQAMDMLLAAKNIAEKEGYGDYLGRIYNNIGLSFKTQGKYREAKEYFRKSMSAQPGDSASLWLGNAQAYHNLGTTLYEMGLPDSALLYYEKALQLRQDYDDNRGIVSTLNNVGAIYQELDQLDKAKQIFRKLINKTYQLRDLYGYALAYHNLASSHFLQGNIDSAIIFNDSAIIFGERTASAQLLMQLHDYQSQYLEARGDYEKALSHDRIADAISDSVFTVQKEKQIEELQTKFRTEQKEQELALSKKKEELASSQRNLLLILLVGVVIIGALTVVLLRIRVRKKKQLLEKNEALHQKEKQLNEIALEKSRLEREKLMQELEQKSRELTTHSLNLIQKKKLLEEVQEKISEAKKSAENGTRAALTKVSQLVRHSFNLDDDWQRFQHYFDNLHQSFFEHLKQQHPALTSNDLRLCALIRMNFSVKESASILNISPGSMKTARYRLRKKLELGEGDDLYNYLLQF